MAAAGLRGRHRGRVRDRGRRARADAYLAGFLGAALGIPATTGAVLFLAWSGTSVLSALLARRIPARVSGRVQLAIGLLGVAAGQLALGGVAADSTWVRFVPGLLVAGVASGILNAALGREAVASVPAGRSGWAAGPTTPPATSVPRSG